MSAKPDPAHVARLYYLRGCSKQEVAARLGISRFRVARLLEAARSSGVVKIEVQAEVEEADEAAQALEQAFGLRHAVVARAAEDVPALACAWLPELLSPGDVLGVAWGATLRAVAATLPQLDLEVSVVQICGAIPGLDGGTGPSEIAFRVSERLSAPLHGLPAPALASPAARDELLRNDAVRPTVELFDRVTVALLGIGTAPPDAPPETAGHLLVYLFDDHGRVLRGELEAIALPLERLREARVIAVARGRTKHRAVAAALRTGLLDALVTDEPTARYALEHA